MEILSILKGGFSVFEKCQFLVALFCLGKKLHFMQKASVFGQMTEFLSKVIKWCHANFEAKWQVFLSISILVQKCQFCAKRIEILGEMLTFSLSVPYYWKWLLLQNMPIFFVENVTFVWRFIYINSVKLW